MPSRINIGPENGPFVAINESSGNLQLEDNSGNVVAEWDETNAQWDFANNTLANVDALNSNSVITEKLNSEDTAQIGNTFEATGDDLAFPIPDRDTVILRVLTVRSQNDGESLNLQMSDDGGDSFLTDYAFSRDQKQVDGTDLSEDNASAEHIKLSEELNDSLSVSNPTLYIGINKPRDNKRTTLSFWGAVRAEDAITRINGAGLHNASSEIDAVRFYSEDNDSDELQEVKIRVIQEPGAQP